MKTYLQNRPKMAPERFQDGTKITPSTAKMAPRPAKICPRWPQGAPKMAQDGSKMAARLAKMTPRWLKMASSREDVIIHGVAIAILPFLEDLPRENTIVDLRRQPPK